MSHETPRDRSSWAQAARTTRVAPSVGPHSFAASASPRARSELRVRLAGHGFFARNLEVELAATAETADEPRSGRRPLDFGELSGPAAMTASSRLF